MRPHKMFNYAFLHKISIEQYHGWIERSLATARHIATEKGSSPVKNRARKHNESTSMSCTA